MVERRRRKTVNEDESKDSKTNNQTDIQDDVDTNSVSDNANVDDSPKVEPGRDRVDKVSEYSGLTEMFESKTYKIRAKNMPDAQRLLDSIVQSQDRIESLKSTNRGYLAKVDVFIAREM